MNSGVALQHAQVPSPLVKSLWVPRRVFFKLHERDSEWSERCGCFHSTHAAALQRDEVHYDAEHENVQSKSGGGYKETNIMNSAAPLS